MPVLARHGASGNAARELRLASRGTGAFTGRAGRRNICSFRGHGHMHCRRRFLINRITELRRHLTLCSSLWIHLLHLDALTRPPFATAELNHMPGHDQLAAPAFSLIHCVRCEAPQPSR
jgi:hypothetical protein